jgi:hypothetical protein
MENLTYEMRSYRDFVKFPKKIIRACLPYLSLPWETYGRAFFEDGHLAFEFDADTHLKYITCFYKNFKWKANNMNELMVSIGYPRVNNYIDKFYAACADELVLVDTAVCLIPEFHFRCNPQIKAFYGYCPIPQYLVNAREFLENNPLENCSVHWEDAILGLYENEEKIDFDFYAETLGWWDVPENTPIFSQWRKGYAENIKEIHPLRLNAPCRDIRKIIDKIAAAEKKELLVKMFRMGKETDMLKAVLEAGQFEYIRYMYGFYTQGKEYLKNIVRDYPLEIEFAEENSEAEAGVFFITKM